MHAPMITFLSPLPNEENEFTGFKAMKPKSKSDKIPSDGRAATKIRDYLVGDFVLLEAKDSVPITVAEVLRVWEETESKSKLVSVSIYYPTGTDAVGSDKCEEVLALDKSAVLECEELFLNERGVEMSHTRGGRKRKLALLTSQRIVPDRNIPVMIVTKEQFDKYTQLKQSQGTQFESTCTDPDTQKSLNLTHSQLLAPIFLFCSRIAANPTIASAFKCSNATSPVGVKSPLISKITCHSPLKSSQQGGKGGECKKDTLSEPVSPRLRRSERISESLSPTKLSESISKSVSPPNSSSPPTSPLKRRKPESLPDLPCPLSPSARSSKHEPTSPGPATPPNSPTKHSMCLRNAPKSPSTPTPTTHKPDSPEVFKTPRKRYHIPTLPPKRPRLEVVMPDKATYTSLSELFDYDDLRMSPRSRPYVPSSPSRCRESVYTPAHLKDLTCEEELPLTL